MHFSQGWVQFGYRFSLDFAPWAILLVAIGLERIAARTAAAGHTGRTLEEPAFGIDRRAGAWAIVAVAIVLVAVSVFVNLWGVVWGDVLGW